MPSNNSTDSLVAKILGLRILKRPAGYIRGSDGQKTIYAIAHVIFTPISGIFDENNPPQ